MSLNEKVRVTWNDLEVGRKLSWDVYTEGGKLLLKAGQVIPNQQVLDGMCKYVLYRYEHDGVMAQGRKQKHINVFDHVDTLIPRIEHMYAEIDGGDVAVQQIIPRLVEDIRHMCELEPDASLALLHLPEEYPPSLFHPIRRCIAAVFMLQSAELSDAEKSMILSAALTADAGMHNLLDQLARQDGLLTPDQDDEVKRHPVKGVRLLQAIGIQDKIWLKSLLQHHERGDGSGYPEGLSLEAICPGARILAIADHYIYKVTSHRSRQPLTFEMIFDQSFSDKGFAWDNRYVTALRDVLGIYPPGSCVTLNNGEAAVVIKRGSHDPARPIVKSFLGPSQQRYIKPLYRECGLNNYEVAALRGYIPDVPLNYSQVWEYA